VSSPPLSVQPLYSRSVISSSVDSSLNVVDVESFATRIAFGGASQSSDDPSYDWLILQL